VNSWDFTKLWLPFFGSGPSEEYAQKLREYEEAEEKRKQKEKEERERQLWKERKLALIVSDVEKKFLERTAYKAQKTGTPMPWEPESELLRPEPKTPQEQLGIDIRAHELETSRPRNFFDDLLTVPAGGYEALRAGSSKFASEVVRRVSSLYDVARSISTKLGLEQPEDYERYLKYKKAMDKLAWQFEADAAWAKSQAGQRGLPAFATVALSEATHMGGKILLMRALGPWGFPILSTLEGYDDGGTQGAVSGLASSLLFMKHFHNISKYLPNIPTRMAAGFATGWLAAEGKEPEVGKSFLRNMLEGMVLPKQDEEGLATKMGQGVLWAFMSAGGQKQRFIDWLKGYPFMEKPLNDILAMQVLRRNVFGPTISDPKVREMIKSAGGPNAFLEKLRKAITEKEEHYQKIVSEYVPYEKTLERAFEKIPEEGYAPGVLKAPRAVQKELAAEQASVEKEIERARREVLAKERAPQQRDIDWLAAAKQRSAELEKTIKESGDPEGKLAEQLKASRYTDQLTGAKNELYLEEVIKPQNPKVWAVLDLSDTDKINVRFANYKAADIGLKLMAQTDPASEIVRSGQRLIRVGNNQAELEKDILENVEFIEEAFGYRFNVGIGGSLEEATRVLELNKKQSKNLGMKSDLKTIAETYDYTIVQERLIEQGEGIPQVKARFTGRIPTVPKPIFNLLHDSTKRYILNRSGLLADEQASWKAIKDLSRRIGGIIGYQESFFGAVAEDYPDLKEAHRRYLSDTQHNRFDGSKATHQWLWENIFKYTKVKDALLHLAKTQKDLPFFYRLGMKLIAKNKYLTADLRASLMPTLTEEAFGMYNISADVVMLTPLMAKAGAVKVLFHEAVHAIFDAKWSFVPPEVKRPFYELWRAVSIRWLREHPQVPEDKIPYGLMGNGSVTEFISELWSSPEMQDIALNTPFVRLDSVVYASGLHAFANKVVDMVFPQPSTAMRYAFIDSLLFMRERPAYGLGDFKFEQSGFHFLVSIPNPDPASPPGSRELIDRIHIADIPRNILMAQDQAVLASWYARNRYRRPIFAYGGIKQEAMPLEQFMTRGPLQKVTYGPTLRTRPRTKIAKNIAEVEELEREIIPNKRDLHEGQTVYSHGTDIEAKITGVGEPEYIEPMIMRSVESRLSTIAGEKYKFPAQKFTTIDEAYQWLVEKGIYPQEVMTVIPRGSVGPDGYTEEAKIIEQYRKTGGRTEKQKFLEGRKEKPEWMIDVPEAMDRLLNSKDFWALSVVDRAKVYSVVERHVWGRLYSESKVPTQNRKTAWKTADTWRACDNSCIGCYANKMAIMSNVMSTIPVRCSLRGYLKTGEILRLGEVGDPAGPSMDMKVSGWEWTIKEVQRYIAESQAKGQIVGFENVFYNTKLQRIDGFDPTVIRNMEVSLDPMDPRQMEISMKNIVAIKKMDPTVNIAVRIRSINSLDPILSRAQADAVKFANMLKIPVLETRMRFTSKLVMAALNLDVTKYRREHHQFRGLPALKELADNWHLCDKSGQGKCETCLGCIELMVPGTEKMVRQILKRKLNATELLRAGLKEVLGNPQDFILKARAQHIEILPTGEVVGLKRYSPVPKARTRPGSIEERMDAFKKFILGKRGGILPTGTLPPEEMTPAGRLLSLNLSKYDDPVRDWIIQEAEKYSQPLTQLRGGPKPWAEVIKEAKTVSLRVPMESLFSGLLQRTLNLDSAILAAHNMLADFQQAIAKAQDAYAKNPTAENAAKLEYAKRMGSVAFIYATFPPREIGRALNQFKILRQAQGHILTKNYMDALRIMRKMGVDTEENIKALTLLDPNNPHEVLKFLEALHRPTMGQKFYEAWVNGLLSNPVTHMTNTISNFITMATMPIETLMSAAGAKFLSVFDPRYKNAVRAGQSLAEVAGFVSAFPQGLKAFVNTMLHSTTTWDDTGILSDALARLPAIKGKKGEIIRIPSRLLEAADDMFKTWLYSMKLYSEAYRLAVSAKEKDPSIDLGRKIRDLLRDPTPGMKDAASKEAIYRTYQENLSGLVRKVSLARNDMPALAFLIPFVRTPYNIVKFAMQRTPLEVIRVFRHGSEGFVNVSPQEASAMTARAIFSIPIAIGLAQMVLNGDITGSVPDDPEDRARFYAEGKLPKAIRIGKKWVSLERIQPLSLTVGIIADTVDLLKRGIIDEDEAGKLIARTIFIIGSNITDNTFLKGLNDAIEAWNDPLRKGETWYKSMVGSMIPAGVQSVTRAIDPVVRDVNNLLDIFKARIPGLSKQLAPKVSEMGEEIKRPGVGFGGGLLGTVGRMISPIKIQDETEDEVIKELASIRYYPGKISEKVGDVRLPPHAYAQLAIEAGREAREAMAKLIKTPRYQRMTREEKIAELRKTIAQVRKKARKPLYQEYANVQ